MRWWGRLACTSQSLFPCIPLGLACFTPFPLAVKECDCKKATNRVHFIDQWNFKLHLGVRHALCFTNQTKSCICSSLYYISLVGQHILVDKLKCVCICSIKSKLDSYCIKVKYDLPSFPLFSMILTNECICWLGICNLHFPPGMLS